MEMKRIDQLVYELTDEIDYYREQAQMWKDKYDELRNELNEQRNQRLKSAQQGVANALLFALHVKDDENGNLVISKEDRKMLANKITQDVSEE